MRKLTILAAISTLFGFISIQEVSLSLELADVKMYPFGVLDNCSQSKINNYVNKLGTPEITSSEFESLIKCDNLAVPALRKALDSETKDVRASAAYALGEIAVSKENVRKTNSPAITIIRAREALETSEDVLTILQSYRAEGPCRRGWHSRRNCDPPIVIRKEIDSRTSTSSPIVCLLPGIRRIFPRCT